MSGLIEDSKAALALMRKALPMLGSSEKRVAARHLQEAIQAMEACEQQQGRREGGQDGPRS